MYTYHRLAFEHHMWRVTYREVRLFQIPCEHNLQSWIEYKRITHSKELLTQKNYSLTRIGQTNRAFNRIVKVWRSQSSSPQLEL